jgi:hypothetical protein
MSDPSSGLEVSETVPGSKRLDFGVFLKIGRAGILDIMVESGDVLGYESSWLPFWNLSIRGAVIVRHAVGRILI